MIKFIFYIFLFIGLLIDWKIGCLFLILSAIWRRFYQVRRIPRTQLIEYKQNTFFAPVHAKVLDIYQKSDSFFLKVRVGLFAHKGFYAMSYADVDSVEFREKGKIAWGRTSLKKLVIQKKYSSLLLKFLKNNIVTTINILHTVMPARPSTLIMPGDRVTPGAHLGWLPFGGIIIIELPLSGKLKVRRGDQLKFYNTVLMEL